MISEIGTFAAILWGRFEHPHFTEKEMETQRGTSAVAAGAGNWGENPDRPCASATFPGARHSVTLSTYSLTSRILL